jgi:hypothetical protein
MQHAASFDFRSRLMRIGLAILIASTIFMVNAFSGCGFSAGSLAALVPAKGKVTYKGKPLSQGTIRFEPDGYGRMATGKLQSDGTFVLSTLKEGDGVVAGVHKVFITDLDKTLAKDRAFKKYMQSGSSGLTADVSPENTEFTFDLK